MRRRALSYVLAFTGHRDGHEWTERDPYSFGIILGPLDLHLFARASTGSSTRNSARTSWTIDGVHGTRLPRLGAECAARLASSATSTHWDGRRAPMRKLLGCGVWEIFLPGVGEGAHYKFEVKHVARRHRAEERSVRVLRPARHGRRRRSSSISIATNGATPSGWRARETQGVAPRADEHLRSPSRLVAAQSRRKAIASSATANSPTTLLPYVV